MPVEPAAPTASTSESKVPFTRSATRKAAAAPALAYLNRDKVLIGNFLALLVGKNEFMQKVLVSELQRRYYELTTVKSNVSKSVGSPQANVA